MTTESIFNIAFSDFSHNIASSASTIEVLGSSPTLTNYIVQCNFESNVADTNTISFNQALAVISKSFFTNN